MKLFVVVSTVVLFAAAMGCGLAPIRGIALSEVYWSNPEVPGALDVGEGFVLIPQGAENELLEYRVMASNVLDGPVPAQQMRFMSMVGFDALLRQVDRERLVGRIIRPPGVVPASSMRQIVIDEHEGAIVERHDVLGREANDPHQVESARIVFFRPIRGTVDALASPETSMTPDYRARIDGTWYWVPSRTFHDLTIGRHGVVRAAGPIEH